MSKNITRATEHPPHVWEAKRQLFTRLYKDEKRTLAEVQQIMQDDGFYATERQYKRRIKKWNLEKNSKMDEKHQALLSLQNSETSFDMTCVYKLNGKDIAAHKLLRYARSQNLKTTNIVCKAMGGRCRAPKTDSKGISVSLALAPDCHIGNKEIVFQDLHELLASFICFVWFEKWDTLDSLPSARSPLSFPNAAFLKWTMTVLKTTGLPTNNVLLAALYVYRLKSINPTVIGKAGSEYRVAVTSLILANKFLHDNYYTNKTWAEVSGISVLEIKVMEIEFLSNMRYNLMVQPCAWEFWLKQLGKFQEYFRQPPTEPPRAIEVLEMPQSDLQTVQSRAADTEMYDIDDGSITDVAPRDASNVPDYDMPDIPSPAWNDTSDPKMQQRNRHDDMEDFPSNEFESLEDAMANASDGEPDLQINGGFNKNIENITTALEIDTDASKLVDTSFANLLPSPPFPSILTMELPPPPLIAGDTLLEWRSIDSSELQEGPIPDLETFLDPSLWEDSWEMLQLEQNLVPRLE